MLWINPDQYPSGEALDLEQQQSTPLVQRSIVTEPDFDGVQGRMIDAGKALNFVDYIQEDIGGEMAPEYQLGYTTGYVSVEQKWRPFDGQTLVGADVPNSAVIFASEQYGDVGLSNANQVKVAQLEYQANVWTPSDQDAAVTFITPGFEQGADLTNG